MIGGAASAGMVSAAVLLASGCEAPPPRDEEKGAELRQASYRSYAAAERLGRCGWGGRPEAAQQMQRFETLKDFARRRSPGAAQSLWRGENAWNAMAERGGISDCGAYAAALTEFSASLDGLVNGIMHYED